MGDLYEAIERFDECPSIHGNCRTLQIHTTASSRGRYGSPLDELMIYDALIVFYEKLDSGVSIQS